jgi:hypothetical protein
MQESHHKKTILSSTRIDKLPRIFIQVKNSFIYPLNKLFKAALMLSYDKFNILLLLFISALVSFATSLGKNQNINATLGSAVGKLSDGYGFESHQYLR